MKTSIVAIFLTAFAGTALAQPVGLTNAEVDTRLSAGNPAAAVQQADSRWLAFSFPVIDGTHSPCCWNGNWKKNSEIGCSLEQETQSYGTLSTAPLEENIIAYVSVVDGKVSQMKITGEQCPMDAGGQTVSWIGETEEGATLDWLEDLVRNGEQDATGHPALWAIALHAGDGANHRLHTLAREKGQEMAEESIFWLGAARGEAGYEALSELLTELPAGDTRRHINFALGQNESDQAAGLLKKIAQSDPDPEQRADALFWLAQENPATAQKVILDVIENEQDEEILERAVFALSQLPGDVAGPALLDLVKDSDAPREARRQAMFWLAHEGDEASVNELTELITR
jgi:hypothetical protein